VREHDEQVAIAIETGVCPYCGKAFNAKMKNADCPVCGKKLDDERPEFAEVKTIKEANEYAENVLGIPKADYKGVDIKVANEMNRSFNDMLHKFPELKDGMQFVGETHQRNQFIKDYIFDYYYQDAKANNPDMDEAALKKEAREAVKTMIGSYKSYSHIDLTVVESENMAVSFSSRLQHLNHINGITVNSIHGENPTAWLESLNKQVKVKFHPIGCDTIKSVIDHEFGHQLDNLLRISENSDIINLYKSRSNEQITNELSSYVWDNKKKNKIREFVAEGWAEYCNNPGDEVRPIAKQIGKLIESEYGRLYGIR